jgi:hypothetical protein
LQDHRFSFLARFAPHVAVARAGGFDVSKRTMTLRRVRTIALTLICSALPCPAALGAHAVLTAPVDELQFDSHTRLGYEDVVWVAMPGSWPGVSCAGHWAWFNGKDNPQFVATLLSARATGMPVKVYVDDALLKKDGFCQVFVIMM